MKRRFYNDLVFVILKVNRGWRMKREYIDFKKNNLKFYNIRPRIPLVSTFTFAAKTCSHTKLL